MTNYDTDPTLTRSPNKFYQNEIPPMFLHNVSPTLLGLLSFLIKSLLGMVCYSLVRRCKKDNFNPKDKVPTFLYGMYK